MKAVAIVMCDDHLYSGGWKTINSLKYFHPEIEVCLYDTKEINRIKKEYDVPDNLWFSAPIVCMDYVKKHGMPDFLFKIGADSLILHKLDEVFDGDYDVACARTDNDYHTQDERHNRPDIIRNIPNHEWVIADFVVIKNYEFLKSWLDLTLSYKSGEIYALKDYGKIYKGDDMSSLNVTFRLGGFKTKILDSIDTNLIYGARGNFDSHNGYCAESIKQAYGGIFYNWSSWFDIKSDMTNFILQDKIVKVLHHSGGTNELKLNFDLFSRGTREYVKRITGFDK